MPDAPPDENWLAAAHAAGRDTLLPNVLAERLPTRVAQAFARRWPKEVAGLVVTPGYPGVKEYIRSPRSSARVVVQHLHQLPLLRELLDGDRDKVATYLRHSGPTGPQSRAWPRPQQRGRRGENHSLRWSAQSRVRRRRRSGLSRNQAVLAHAVSSGTWSCCGRSSTCRLRTAVANASAT